MMKTTRYTVPRVIALIAVSLPLGFKAVVADERDPGSLLKVEHMFEMASVGDPRLSPEGDWVAYTVSRRNLEEEKSETRIWMVPAAGGEPLPLTAEGESSSQPRWSPDGKYISFLSSRDKGKTQVWTLSRHGGEAVQLTEAIQSVQSHAWSPDGKRMLLVLQDPTPEELGKQEQGDDYQAKPRPWVIDRQGFKTDYVGYLDRRRTHIYVLDVETREVSQLTSGDYDDSQPAWSPDGGRVAFVSNRSEEPDLNFNSDIWVVSSAVPEEGFNPLEQVTTNPGDDQSPAWSPDGTAIAHTSTVHPRQSYYATQHLAVSSADGSDSRLLTEVLDRMIFQPAFAPDGESIWFLLEDSGEQNLARIPVGGGRIERIISGRDVVQGLHVGSDGAIAALISNPHMPAELFLQAGAQRRQLTFTNTELVKSLSLGEVVEVQFESADGTPIESFIIKPPGFVEGKKYPAILNIHGGPQSQYDFGFNFEGQLYAANGYLLIHPNPRGSTGYGQEFCLAIWQAWGEPDYDDVMAAVDHAIELGWADPDRLGVMGWSYGGMLTNHIITKTDRFEAAVTGASATLYVVNYGHDMYIRWWEQELGQPWVPEARALYEKLSPFNKVENVVTPTLIMGGEKDWNVPIINSEQLYLALRRLGVDTELVVYPDEYHGIAKPTLEKDVYDRHLAWFEKYVLDE